MKLITAGILILAGAICLHGYMTAQRPDLRIEETAMFMLVTGVLGVA